MNIRNRPQDDQAIEARLAARLAGALTLRLDALPQDVSERLRFAHEQAAGRARDVRRAASAGSTVVGVSASGAGVLSGFVPWWQRAAAVVPLIMLVAGLLVIDRWAVREQVVAAADFDAQLLADDLPPAAYSDPGFAEFIRSAPTP